MCFMCGNCFDRGPEHDKRVRDLLEEREREFFEYLSNLANGRKKLSLPNVKKPWPDVAAIFKDICDFQRYLRCSTNDLAAR